MSAHQRVLHVPGRTPYSRKLRGSQIEIVNEEKNHGTVVPRDATFVWLDGQDSFAFFDILHIQSLELVGIASIWRVLERCRRECKGVILTVHELDPLFPNDPDDFPDRMRLAAQFSDHLITLTASARDAISTKFGIAPSRIRVVPHGPVLPLTHSLWHSKLHRNSRFTLGMYGGFRPNRSFIAAAVNALYGLGSNDVTVRILTRGLNPIEVMPSAEAWQVISLAAVDERLTLELVPFPSDDEVAAFVHSIDVLVLPYLFGTHSGQLELAMDLGVSVIAPKIGCYADQWRLHSTIVPEPFWFQHAPKDPYSFGAPLLQAMLTVYTNWKEKRWDAFDRELFLSIRQHEEKAIIEAHRELYASSIARV